MISIYTITFNAEIHIQFMIDHYKTRFPNCSITVFDNMSTDDTVKIAKANGCEVLLYDTNNQIQDRKYLEIKNGCWKTAKTDWVLICDIDELLEISESQLKKEEALGSSIIRTEGYNMINMVDDNADIRSISFGARAEPYDKSYCFNKTPIFEINYEAGCHQCKPVGQIKYSADVYKAYHYNFINIDLALNKNKLYATRLSPENIKQGWGNQYLLSENKIREEFADIRSKAIKLF